MSVSTPADTSSSPIRRRLATPRTPLRARGPGQGRERRAVSLSPFPKPPAPRRARIRSRRRAGLLLLLAVLLGACELETRASLDLSDDGSGTVALEAELDEALLDELDRLGVDPFAELTAAVAADPVWRLEREPVDGGLRLRAVRERTTDPAGALAALGEGLADTDPGLVADLDVDVDAEGGVEVAGTARLRAPVAPGVMDADAAGEAPDGEALTELTARHVRAELEVTLPGRVVRHDADRVDGRTLGWSLPPDTAVDVHATAVPARVPVEVWTVSAALLLLGLAAGGVMLVLRRR